ncbi:MAG: RNA polymerase sigma factor [Siphonobacter aquaeclarae]|jgi:RNA polymerase sigma factor (sigma-70 family)|nr:RNA polymerase sigma factor [Siphonobacter aquaeclarae]
MVEEEVIWQHFREGDRQAFARLYERYFPILYGYGFRLSGDEEVVKDAIQTLFVELWKSRAGLSATSSVKFYLFRVLRRKIHEQTRRVTLALPEDYHLEFDYSPETDLIQRERLSLRREKLEQALRQLHPRQKEALSLLYLEGLSYPEIAGIMDIKVRTVYNLVHTALQVLRTTMPAALRLLALLSLHRW